MIETESEPNYGVILQVSSLRNFHDIAKQIGETTGVEILLTTLPQVGGPRTEFRKSKGDDETTNNITKIQRMTWPAPARKDNGGRKDLSEDRTRILFRTDHPVVQRVLESVAKKLSEPA